MRWIYCFECGTRFEYQPSQKHVAYYCPKCDEVFFEQTQYWICPLCQNYWHTSYELLSWIDYQGKRTIEIEAICPTCSDEVQNEG